MCVSGGGGGEWGSYRQNSGTSCDFGQKFKSEQQLQQEFEIYPSNSTKSELSYIKILRKELRVMDRVKKGLNLRSQKRHSNQKSI